MIIINTTFIYISFETFCCFKISLFFPFFELKVQDKVKFVTKLNFSRNNVFIFIFKTFNV
jgi:hypothetical protein